MKHLQNEAGSVSARRKLRSRDVIHAAVMFNNGISKMISTDKHFDVIMGIRRIDPLDRI